MKSVCAERCHLPWIFSTTKIPPLPHKPPQLLITDTNAWKFSTKVGGPVDPANPVVDIVAAREHVVITTRVEAVLLRVLPSDRVQCEVSRDLALIDPGVVTIGLALNTRPGVSILGR